MKIAETEVKTHRWGPDDDYHTLEIQVDPAFHPAFKEGKKAVILAFSPEEFEDLFEVKDTTEFIDEEYNVNGTVRVHSRGLEKLIETILRYKHRFLVAQFRNLEVNLLDTDLPNGVLNYCIEDKEGDKLANQKAIQWWRPFVKK